MLSTFNIFPCRMPAKQKKIFVIFMLVSSGFTASAQDSVRIKPIRITLIDHNRSTGFYKPFAFPLSHTIDYSNYPLTANEILRRNAQATAYNRVYNTITNYNGNGVVRNLFGLQKAQKPHPLPGF